MHDLLVVELLGPETQCFPPVEVVAIHAAPRPHFRTQTPEAKSTLLRLSCPTSHIEGNDFRRAARDTKAGALAPALRR